MTAAVEIGRCRCPVCNNPNAFLRVSVKQLAYVVCNACQSQAFARSEHSDELLRARAVVAPPAPIAKPAAVASAPSSRPAPSSKPAPVASAPAPAPAPALAPAPAPTPTPPPAVNPSWGFASWTA